MRTQEAFAFNQAAVIELPPGHHGIQVCYGAGVDSTAMLIALYRQGIVPDVITFADVGGEKPETYRQVEIMSAWCKAHGFPEIVTVAKIPEAKTGYVDLYGNNHKNETLPSLAFGKKSCSIKWKADPQDYFMRGKSAGPYRYERQAVYQEALDLGKKVVKLIGYDAGPADSRRSKKARTECEHFLYCYPLQQLGWTREDCIQAILEEGLAVPIKSACFFCPASQKWELWWLAGEHPDLLQQALDMEHRAMIGKHSRWGSDECTYGKDWEELVNQPATQWPTTSITVGLGRTFAWNHWARQNGVCTPEGQVISDRERYLAKAAELKGDGGNASDSAKPCF